MSAQMNRPVLITVIALLLCAAAASVVIYQQKHDSTPGTESVSQQMAISGSGGTEKTAATQPSISNVVKKPAEKTLHVRTIWTVTHQAAPETTVTMTLSSRSQSLELRRELLTNDTGEVDVKFPAAWHTVNVSARHPKSLSAYRLIDTTTTNSIVMVLLPASTMFGTVRMEGSGEPVAGAEVRNFGGVRTVSGADGTYELDGLGKGQVRVYAQKGNLTSLTQETKPIDMDSQPRVGPVDLLLKPGCTLRGTIKDNAGNPVPGIRLSLQAQFAPREIWKSDSNGEYHMRGLPVGEYQVILTKDSAPIDNKPCKIELNKDNVLDFIMPALTTVFGTVYGPDKAPAAGAEINKMDDGWGDTTISGEQGEYEISGVMKDEIRLFARSELLISSLDMKPKPVKIKTGQRNGPIDLYLIPGLVVKGKITAAATKEPVAEARVYLNDQWVTRESVSKLDGQFEVTGLPQTQMHYSVSAKGFASKSDKIQLKSGEPNQLDVELEREAIVFGHVYDAATKAPVAGAKVYTLPNQMGLVQSKEDGSFELKGLRAGKWALAASKGELLSAVSKKESEQFEVVTGERSGPHDLYLKPGLKIEGVVANSETQQPIENAVIHLYNGERKSVKTDSAGHFVIGGLMAGPINFQVSAENYMSDGNVQAQVSAENPEPVMVMLRPAVTIFGHVYLEKEGAAASKAQVMITDMQTHNGNGSSTLADGSYEMQVPICESVRISARMPPYVSSLDRELEKTFPIKAGERNGPFDLILQRGLNVVGTVTDKESHMPLPGAKVRYQNYSQEVIPCDMNGKFRIEGLTTESARLECWAEGYCGIQQTVMPSQATDAICDFALTRGGDLEVRVTNPENKPVAKANIWINYNQGNYMRPNNDNIETDVAGVAIIKGIDRTAKINVQANSNAMSGNTEVTFPEGQMRVVANVAIKKNENTNTEPQEQEPGVVVGSVTDESGRGLPGITIKTRWNDSNFPSTTTDGAGNYKCTSENMRKGFSIQLTAAGPGYAMQEKDGRLGTAKEPGRLDFKLEQGHWLVVSVLDSSQKTVPKASLSLNSSGGGNFGRNFNMQVEYKPDAQGKMKIDSLPDGQVNVNASTPDGRNGYQECLVDQEMQLILKDVGVVHGKLVDAETNQPITVFSLSQYGEFVRYTHPNGEFVLERLQLEGEVSFTVQAEGYATTVIKAHAVPLASRNDVQTFKISKANLLTAILSDASTGARIAGATVYYLPGNDSGRNINWDSINQNYGQKVEKKTTGPDGGFFFQEGEPRGLVLIKAAGYERVFLFPEDRKQSSALEPLSIALKKGASITIELVAPANYKLESGSIHKNQENQNGRFPGGDANKRIYESYEQPAKVDATHIRWDSLPAAKYSLSMSYTTAENVGGSASKEITVAAGENAVVQMGPPVGASSVYGLITLDGQPLKDTQVYFNNPHGSQYGKTDVKGTYSFTNIPDGEANISVQLPEGRRGSRSLRNQQVVIKGATRCDLVLQSSKDLIGSIGISNDPAPGKWRITQVSFSRENGSGNEVDYNGQSAVTNGQFKCTGKFSGNYRVNLTITTNLANSFSFEAQTVALDNLQGDQDLGVLACPPLGMLGLNVATPVGTAQVPVNVILTWKRENNRNSTSYSSNLRSGQNLLGPFPVGLMGLQLNSQDYSFNLSPAVDQTISENETPWINVTMSKKATPTPTP